MNPYPAPNFAHLLALSGPHGTYEHAEYHVPRVAHGYCVDDVARVLVVVMREPRPDHHLVALSQLSLDFLAQAQTPVGTFRNRRNADGEFCAEAFGDDSWGRAMWALGTCAAATTSWHQAETALQLFKRGAFVTSHHRRSLAFAALGAVEILSINPSDVAAHSILHRAATVVQGGSRSDWPWREARLTYANAVLPEAMMIAGDALADEALVKNGLEQLAWLLNRATANGFLSVAPASGAGPDDDGHQFDQQPIEVAAIADACSRAHQLTGQHDWLDGVRVAADWFMGVNDGGVMMYDPTTGGGFDGLTPEGPNRNQGAESTLSFLSTMQQARHYLVATS